MAARVGIGLEGRQRQALAADVHHALAMLQMPAAELAALIAGEAEANPLLELPSAPPSAAEAVFPDVPAGVSRGEGLRRQLALMRLPADIAPVADYLTECLADDGYLAEAPAEIAARLGIAETQVLSALAALQRCEPAGIAARDLAECLLLQLLERGADPHLSRALTDHLALAARGAWRAIARRTGLPERDLAELGGRLPELSPRPGAADAAEPGVLLPEISVSPDGRGGFEVSVRGDLLPALALDPAAPGARGLRDTHARRYLVEHRRRAHRLIDAVGYRQRTLLRLGQALVAAQRGFFERGPEHMAPLTRGRLAGTLGVHVSTVARAVAGKALVSPWGTQPLASFFTPGLAAAEGATVSAFALQRRIRRMIAEEPPGAPLSDAEIAARLQFAGVDIARRTVAKYRGCMTIPPSHRRQKSGSYR